MKLYCGIFVILSIGLLTMNVNANENFSQNNAIFTLDLLNETIKSLSDKNDNIIISPLSIQICLALTFIGAEGKTAEELSNGLRLGTLDKQTVAKSFNDLLKLSNDDDNVTVANKESNINSLITIANKIYAQNDIKINDEFQHIAKMNFDSSIENVDFKKNTETAKQINNWIEEKTNNKIRNLIEPDGLNDAKVLLINAIYFRGEWKIPFIKEVTHKEKFWLSNEDSVDVDMMAVEDDFLYGELKDLNAIAVQLPYNNSDLSMLVIVPNEKIGLKELENNLNSIDLMDIEKRLERNEVSLQFPKFKNEFSIKLNDVLKNMGMGTMFTDNADFSHMTTFPIKVDEVYHKAVIEVDEIGTEAAGATYLKAVPLSANFNTKYLTVDRPFMYFIKDKNSVYFMGRVTKF